MKAEFFSLHRYWKEMGITAEYMLEKQSGAFGGAQKNNPAAAEYVVVAD
jgi:hypothetical protein